MTGELVKRKEDGHNSGWLVLENYGHLLVFSGISSGMEGRMDSGTMGHVVVREGWVSTVKVSQC